MVTVVCVLRSGGDFRPEHVERLRQGVEDHLGAAFVCLTDMEPDCARVPLKYGWPGWFSKMEVFRPDLARLGDIFYADLDTVIVGDLSPFAAQQHLTMLSDFYRMERLASGLMLLPVGARADIWQRWWAQPETHMHQAGRGGDQAFLNEVLPRSTQRWQDVLPGAVVSFKDHVAKNRKPGAWAPKSAIPVGARVVCFHGKPRPWEVW